MPGRWLVSRAAAQDEAVYGSAPEPQVSATKLNPADER